MTNAICSWSDLQRLTKLNFAVYIAFDEKSAPRDALSRLVSSCVGLALNNTAVGGNPAAGTTDHPPRWSSLMRTLRTWSLLRFVGMTWLSRGGREEDSLSIYGRCWTPEPQLSPLERHKSCHLLRPRPTFPRSILAHQASSSNTDISTIAHVPTTT